MRTPITLVSMVVASLAAAAASAQDGYLPGSDATAPAADPGGAGAGEGYLPDSGQTAAEQEGYLPDGTHPQSPDLAALSAAEAPPLLEIGAWAGPDVNTTFAGGDPTVMLGASGAVVFNHVFAIGGAGWGALIDLPPPDNYTALGFDPDAVDLKFSYGGATLEGILFPEQLVSMGVHVLLGGGQVAMVDAETGRSVGASTARLFAAELGADAYFNITSFMRVRAGAGYRLTSVDAEAEWIDNRDLFGPTIHVGVFFGWF